MSRRNIRVMSKVGRIHTTLDQDLGRGCGQQIEVELPIQAWVHEFEMRKLRPVNNIAIKTCIWVTSASNSGLEGTTIALHGKCPVCPDRANHLYAISDVKYISKTDNL